MICTISILNLVSECSEKTKSANIMLINISTCTSIIIICREKVPNNKSNMVPHKNSTRNHG